MFQPQNPNNRYFEYNGTCDVAKRDIHDSMEEVHKHWRQECTHECTCGKPPVDVILYSFYGGGFHWHAKACLACQVIVDGFLPYTDPDGYWPLDGHPLGNYKRLDGPFEVLP